MNQHQSFGTLGHDLEHHVPQFVGGYSKAKIERITTGCSLLSTLTNPLSLSALAKIQHEHQTPHIHR